MRKTAIWAAILTTSAVVAGISFLLPSSGLKILRDISYVPGDTNPSHRLDVYLPEHRSLFEKARPLIVWIHGGAWQSGNKDSTPAAVLPLVGYVAASINYRLTDEASFPAQLEDCQSAIRFLRKHSSEFGIDPDRIGVWGLSSGGHLAAMVGLTGGADGKNMQSGPDSSAVQAVCDWCGPTDFIEISKQSSADNKFELNSPDGPVAKLLGGLPSASPDKARLASPVNFVHAGAPPFLILHGTADEVVPTQQSIELSKLLNKFGNRSILHIIPGGKHDLASKELVEESVRFFDQCLK